MEKQRRTYDERAPEVGQVHPTYGPVVAVEDRKDGETTITTTRFECGCEDSTTFHPRFGFCSNAVGIGLFSPCSWDHSRD